MDKPMLVFKRFGHQLHLLVQKEAKRCGIEFMGGTARAGHSFFRTS